MPGDRRYRRVAYLLAFTLIGTSLRVESQNSSNAATAASYRVAGTLVSASDGHPLSRARVTLANVKDLRNSKSVITEEDGGFSFTGLAEGKYSLQAMRRGFVPGGFDQHIPFWTAIVTGAGVDTEHLLFRLTPQSYIVGQVLDENSDPVRGATVRLYREDDSEGFRRIVPTRGATTNDLGMYELGPDSPGTYFVSATAEVWYAVHPQQADPSTPRETTLQVDPSLDVAYPVTYYGDETTADEATPVQLKGGERFRADIHLSPVPALHLLVHVPTGGPNVGPAFPRLQQSGLNNNDGFLPGVQQRIVSPGVWEITGVPEGNYTVDVFDQATGQMRSTKVSATAQGQDVDATSGDPSAVVNIFVKLPEDKTSAEGLNVGLQVPNGMLNRFAQVDAKGEAHLQQVPPGTYQVAAWGKGKRYSVTELSIGGQLIAGQNLHVEAGTTLAVSATLASGSETVEGVVKDGTKPVAGAMMVLVPQAPENHPDLFRRDQSDLDGTFALRSVVPGKYTVIAIENGWELEWSRPDVIASYLRNGQKIIVGDQQRGAMKLADPVQAQER
jgi:carboxypeptidase family protein